MGVWEILLIVGCVLFVAGVIASRIIAKKKGKPSCDCGCGCGGGCPGCKESEKKKES